MKNTVKKKILCITEGAAMLALASVLEIVCEWLNAATGLEALLPFGGTVTIGMLPVIYYSYRHGSLWGVGAGLVYALLQMLLGFYVPPANTALSIVLCVLLDYVVAFSVVGLADTFAKLCGKHRLVGYGVGAVCVQVIRFISSALSGAILWGSYAPEGMNVWVYTLIYNGSYMLPNIILAGVFSVVLCRALDPRTLKPMKKSSAA